MAVRSSILKYFAKFLILLLDQTAGQKNLAFTNYFEIKIIRSFSKAYIIRPFCLKICFLRLGLKKA